MCLPNPASYLAIDRLPVEGAAIEKGSGRPPRNSLHASLQRLSKWQADGCFDAIFTGSVIDPSSSRSSRHDRHSWGWTTTAAKKGGDNIGFSGHKKMKGDKIVAFCDRNCNVIAPFVAGAGNRNESPMFREALPASDTPRPCDWP